MEAIVPFLAHIAALLAGTAAETGKQAMSFLPFTFIALVVTELLFRYGLMDKLAPLGAPLTRVLTETGGFRQAELDTAKTRKKRFQGKIDYKTVLSAWL